jgi:hypothetical protein
MKNASAYACKAAICERNLEIVSLKVRAGICRMAFRCLTTVQTAARIVSPSR